MKVVIVGGVAGGATAAAQAVGALQKMGYENVKNIGGIASYTGKVER